MSQKQVEVVRRLWAGLNENPPRVLLELLERGGGDKESARVSPSRPVPRPCRGTRLGLGGLLHFELEEVIETGDGETVVSVQRTKGRTRHMQMDTNLQWAAVWIFRGGKVLRAQGYMRKPEALEAAGLSE